MKYFTFILLLILSKDLLAQNKSIKPLQKMVHKISKAGSIQFDEFVKEKSIFSNDTTQRKIINKIFFKTNGEVTSSDIIVKMHNYSGRTVFANKNIYYLESDSSYTVKKQDQYIASFGDFFKESGVLSSVKKSLVHHPERIIKRPDTIINQTACYSFQIMALDTIIESERSYTMFHVHIEKKTNLPVSSTFIAHDVIVKDGHKLGAYDLYSQSYYNNIKLSIGENYLADFKIPKWYHLYKKIPLLAEGIQAPDWSGVDLNGRKYTLKDFEGKILLLFLSDIGCPANQLSISILNKLSDIYKGRNLQIMCIFPESKDRLTNYITSNKLDFPVLYDGMSVKNTYHAPGSPYFYIINQSGKIVKSRTAYSEDLEEILIEIIDQSL